ncbi:MAG TPA: DUF2231 domain-containing protein [Candidatus Angelobacter sp.]|jgi:uncharacterized membrane protein|nr:DUF2231 domain-containing protein [Candidatus Angelobacter sp.]
MNPFDLKSVLLARHAQHVVLIHFPIALFLVSVACDFAAQWKRAAVFATVAYFNLSVAAFSSVPVVATGLMAWRWQLEGQRLKGTLLLHLLLGLASTVLIWLVWWVHFQGRKPERTLPMYRLPLEIVAAGVVALTAHLGGFLSGVNAGV